MKRLIIDLDHTICTPADGEDQASEPSAKYRSARPILAVIEQLRRYRALGFAIVVNTSRNMRTYDGDIYAIQKHTLPVILTWLAENDVPFDEVVIGKPWCGFDGFYIDDRAVRPSEFRSKTYEEILALIAQEQVQL